MTSTSMRAGVRAWPWVLIALTCGTEVGCSPPRPKPSGRFPAADQEVEFALKAQFIWIAFKALVQEGQALEATVEPTDDDLIRVLGRAGQEMRAFPSTQGLGFGELEDCFGGRVCVAGYLVHLERGDLSDGEWWALALPLKHGDSALVSFFVDESMWFDVRATEEDTSALATALIKGDNSVFRTAEFDDWNSALSVVGAVMGRATDPKRVR